MSKIKNWKQYFSSTNESISPQNYLSSIKNIVGDDFIFHFSPTNWGGTIYIMENRGKAFAKLYWFNDTDDTVYLGDLNVEDRRRGLGTKLQEIREEIGRLLGAKTSMLWVVRDTWMHDWYKRRGYEDYLDYEEEENAVWMKKSLE